MSFLLGVVIFVVALLVSVMLHEAGHFVTAKKFGMKATQFFVGFGQTLWSRQKGETEYGVKAMPAGGFVKIIGMTDARGGRPGRRAALVPQAAAAGSGSSSWPPGSFMHFVLAFVLLFVARRSAIGLETANTATTVGTVDTCVPASLELAAACKRRAGTRPASRPASRPATRSSPSAATPVHNWTQMGTAIRAPAGRHPVPVIVQRGTASSITVHADAGQRPRPHGSYLGVAPASVFQRDRPAGRRHVRGPQFGQSLAGSARRGRPSLPTAIPDLFAKNRANDPGGQVTSVVGAARHHRPGGRGPRRLAGQGRRGAADHRLAEHLRRRVQPAAAAAAGRRASRGRDLRADPGLARPAARAARSRAWSTSGGWSR